MAKLPRALLLLVLLLLVACRFSPSHRAAVVRFAVSTILDIASTDDAPAAPVAQHPVRTLPACAYHTAAAKPAEKPAVKPMVIEESAPMPVRPIAIETAALRPAECPDRTEHLVRVEIARWRVERLHRQIESINKQAVRCREASAQAVRDEFRAAHVLQDDDNVCAVDPDAVAVPILDMRIHRTIGS